MTGPAWSQAAPVRVSRGETFVKTPKQREALDLVNSHAHALLYGGARSGKTRILTRNVFLRASRKTSRHLIARFRYKHARRTIGRDTIPKVLAESFPGLEVEENKSDGVYFVRAVDGGTSEVWITGTDDKERVEQLLGTEYSTIYLNECSQISWEAALTLHTRLAERSGLKLRFYYDENPPGKKHWTHALFIERRMPDGSELKFDVAALRMNPADNPHLPPEYVESLRHMPRRQRKRFYSGEFLEDVEGALWTEELIEKAKLKERGPPVRAVVGVDPSVSNTAASDECGIVVAGVDPLAEGVVVADYSGKFSTAAWARRVVNAYNLHEAGAVVAEVNNGGDLVEDAIRNVDPLVRVVKVRASVGKAARAEPVSMLYELGRVSHARDFPELEDELTTWVPESGAKSPNRLDALVWALTHLLIGKQPVRIRIS